MSIASVDDIFAFLGRHTGWEKIADSKQNGGNENDVVENFEFSAYIKSAWDDSEKQLTKAILNEFWNKVDTNKNCGCVNGTYAKDAGALNNEEMKAIKSTATKQSVIAKYKDWAKQMYPEWLKKGGDLEFTKGNYVEKWINNISKDITNIADGVPDSGENYEADLIAAMEEQLPPCLTKETVTQTKSLYSAYLNSIGVYMECDDDVIQELAKAATEDVSALLKNLDETASSQDIQKIKERLDKLCKDIAAHIKEVNKEKIEEAKNRVDVTWTKTSFSASTDEDFSDTLSTEVTQKGIPIDTKATYMLVSQNMPEGSNFTLSADGKISGNFKEAGTYTFSVQALVNGKTAGKIQTMTIVVDEQKYEVGINAPKSVYSGSTTNAGTVSYGSKSNWTIKSIESSPSGCVTPNGDKAFNINAANLPTGTNQISYTVILDVNGREVRSAVQTVNVLLKTVTVEEALANAKWQTTPAGFNIFEDENDEESVSTLGDITSQNPLYSYTNNLFVELYYKENKRDDNTAKDQLKKLCQTISDALVAGGLDKTLLDSAISSVISSYSLTSKGDDDVSFVGYEMIEKSRGNFTYHFSTQQTGILCTYDDSLSKGGTSFYGISYRTLMNDIIRQYNKNITDDNSGQSVSITKSSENNNTSDTENDAESEFYALEDCAQSDDGNGFLTHFKNLQEALNGNVTVNAIDVDGGALKNYRITVILPARGEQTCTVQTINKSIIEYLDECAE